MAPTGQEASAEPLKLLISVEEHAIASPFPARLTLHLHNSGHDALWLYRRARSQATNGSTLQVRVEPMDVSKPKEASTAAEGALLESVGLPRAKMVRLDAGGDYEEKTVIRLAPALEDSKGESQPIWGRYRLSAIYRARFSNAEEIARNLGVEVWQGEVASNAVELELRPAEASAAGSASGTAVGPSARPLPGVIVSLSDEQERLVGQRLTDGEGRFSFTQLPLGLYWLTGRFANSTTDTVVFRHLELTADQPAGALELVMLPQEIYEPKGLLHKPVLFRVKDSAGRPLDKVAVEVTWSSGTVLDKVKGEVSQDGAAAMELIPGRNYVTLKRRGCPKEEERVDVAEGDGLDDFVLVLECAKK